MKKTISGFSRLSKAEKVAWVAEQFFQGPEQAAEELKGFWHQNEEVQRVLDGFSENTISNYYLPFGVAPNFLINGRAYAVPMAIEESSVVAAASSAAKYWMSRGGFKAEVLSTRKLGHVHFIWEGDVQKLQRHFQELEARLRHDAAHLTANMEQRGGGVLDIRLRDMSQLEPYYYQLEVHFETCDSMGANFINSVLEEFSSTLQIFVQEHPAFEGAERQLEAIMAILSNYTPECIVRASVECPVEALAIGPDDPMSPEEFVRKFTKAVRIAQIDPYRATTHNKGIFNGVDAVVLATGNDFRAIEACGHTYAARDGQYRSLSHCTAENGIFRFWLDLPLALGTVGGLTRLHPIARRSLEMLGNPSAPELMGIIAATGLAQNFAALRSLVTTGIQKGHMKMHLMNILNHLAATEQEAREAVGYFSDKAVSFTAVREFLALARREVRVKGKG
ncbi:MAG: hydroxymethylglutaryl-CoA reductase, degradative [Phaeodactylibacter sp.]|nr:hydroxymethylglutaryl-CoA reductase, degradative [Phaeodactylibacter sp.]MCB9273777.1 hydroxymethylglutaryl-CoA reductase, degradative [Lewinellaceae bacterium]